MKKILFKEIKFIDVKYNEFKTLIKKKGLFVFPSGFSLPNIKENNRHHSSLKKADFVFFDSGFFVLLLRFFKNINVFFVLIQIQNFQKKIRITFLRWEQKMFKIMWLLSIKEIKT
jgi:hypothetical protein